MNTPKDFKENAKTVNKIRDACLSNAQNFIDGAKAMAKSEQNNIKYHLGVLALEEIGKASLISSQFTVENTLPTVKEINWGLDDHVKKLFWAFWGGSFAKEPITENLIKQYQGLATDLHTKRIASLYVNPSLEDLYKPTDKEVENLMKLADARLQMEKSYGGINPNATEEEKKHMKFFLDASNDPEKRKLVLGNASLDKLVELGDTKEWIKWIFEEFGKTDRDNRISAIKELNRKKPQGKAALEDKWEMSITLDSISHALRNKDLNEWNKNIDAVKLFSNEKGQLICKFKFPAGVHAMQLWSVGLDRAKEFILALNIGTHGHMYWQVPKKTDKYYESLIDIENKKSLIVAPEKRLELNWKDEHVVLDKTVLVRVQTVLIYLWDNKNNKEFIDAIMQYYSGLTFLSKSDLHLRLEINAFESFYKSFKEFLKLNHAFKETDDLPAFSLPIMKDILTNTENLEDTLKLGVKLEKGTLEFDKLAISLTEVIAMKNYLDAYLTVTAQRHLSAKNKSK